MRSVPTSGVVVLTALVALVAGCGSSSTPSATPTPSSAAATPSAGGSPTASSTDPSTQPSPTDPHPTEFNPPGDIPDDAVFVDHTVPGTRVHFTVPEGWARTTSGAVTTFTDKYNSISVEVRPRASAPTVASARAEDVPELRGTATSFELNRIETVQRRHGSAVQLTYLVDSPPNPVTDKVVRDAVERFDFWRGGEEAILTLTGPQNADNVDPWQIVSDSLQWQ